MTVAVRPEARAARSAALGKGVPRVGERSGTRRPLSTAELAFRIFAALRAHPHINNVLTHISRAQWSEVERSLNVILDPAATGGLSPLGRNIIDLMCAERGVTGKTFKPYFQSTLFRLIEPGRAERLIRHIEALFREIERKAALPPGGPDDKEKPAC